jgi:hypothetical protein
MLTPDLGHFPVQGDSGVVGACRKQTHGTRENDGEPDRWGKGHAIFSSAGTFSVKAGQLPAFVLLASFDRRNLPLPKPFKGAILPSNREHLANVGLWETRRSGLLR